MSRFIRTTELRPHPALAEVYPDQSPEAYKAMKADIAENKILVPLIVAPDGDGLVVLDGHHRLRAARELGLDEVPCTRLDIYDEDAFWRGVALNGPRRNLSREQQRGVIRGLLGDHAHRSDRFIADKVGCSHHTVASVRSEMQERGQIAHAETRIDSAGREQPATKPTTPKTNGAEAGSDQGVGVRPPEATEEEPPVSTPDIPASAGDADTTENGNKLAVHHSSESGEWYTPEHIIDAVRDALGGIDLDPCSNPGEPAVPAGQHFTYMDDGLAQDWTGRVYMNPPYGRGIGEWTEKLLADYEDGQVTAAIALLPARTDTGWMHDLREYPRCFVKGRISFSGHENAAPFPSCAVYFGGDPEAFARAFADLGDTYVLMEV